MLSKETLNGGFTVYTTLPHGLESSLVVHNYSYYEEISYCNFTEPEGFTIIRKFHHCTLF
jgi:hypothetical protein